MTFTFTADPAPTTDLTIDLTIGGDATGRRRPKTRTTTQEIADTFVFPAGKTTYAIEVDDLRGRRDRVGRGHRRRAHPAVQRQRLLRASGRSTRPSGRSGPTARTSVPVLTIDSDSDLIAEGDQATITIEADVERNEDYDIPIRVSGSATSGQRLRRGRRHGDDDGRHRRR